MEQVVHALAEASRAALEQSSRTAELVQENIRQTRSNALSRLVKQPEVFRHDNHKDEVRHFGEWVWSFRRWLESADAEYATELDAIEGHLQETVSNSRLGAGTKERSVALYSALCTLVQGKAQRLIRGVPAGEGYEAYRIIYSHFCPANKQRAVALLQAICTYPMFNEKVPLEESVLAFETLIRDYEKASEIPCPEEISTATLIRCAPQSVRQFLYLRMQDDTRSMNYKQTRDLILSYDKASVVWKGHVTPSGLTVMTDNRESDAMEVDRIENKGKGRGKGKGKDANSKGKGKGKGKGKQPSKSGKGGGKEGKEQNKGKEKASRVSGQRKAEPVMCVAR